MGAFSVWVFWKTAYLVPCADHSLLFLIIMGMIETNTVFFFEFNAEQIFYQNFPL